MNIIFQHNGSTFRVDISAPIDISIPLDFGREQPNAFYLPRAEAVAAEGGDFIGDTRRGGSCNCETITLNPHGNGTHTECVGHLSLNRIHINEALRDVFIPALLLSLPLEPDENGTPCITRDHLLNALTREAVSPDLPLESLIIRTLPNVLSKRHAEWSGHNPPYLSPDAARLIRQQGVRHLLLDLPSLDREEDPLLTSHRIFWELPEEGEVEGTPEEGRTITEMIFVPDEIPDGWYVLNLQVPPFALDAAPSRPLLYRIDSEK